MDYKKIIKNQEVRFRILELFDWVPDEIMIRLQYRIKTGRRLNLKTPRRYSEKLQWYKLFYRDQLMVQCADKYRVREYVESKGLAKILNQLHGVYDNPSEIDFNVLPDKFVIKTTNGSSTNILCKNKSKLSLPEVEQCLKVWLKRDIYASAREWAYKDIIPKIIVEEYLEDENSPFSGINDYKFICFNGKVKYIVLDVDRYTNHKRNFYDTNWTFIPIDSDHPNLGDCILKPEGLEQMLKVANILAEDLPCVRVDLYWVNKRVYFGEMTFYPWAGYVTFSPDEFDHKLGAEFVLPTQRKV